MKRLHREFLGLAAIAWGLGVEGGGDWLDPDTGADGHQTVSYVDGRSFDLVFSDEFNTPGRSFDDGHDDRWTALHKNDYTNNALQ